MHVYICIYYVNIYAYTYTIMPMSKGTIVLYITQRSYNMHTPDYPCIHTMA